MEAEEVVADKAEGAAPGAKADELEKLAAQLAQQAREMRSAGDAATARQFQVQALDTAQAAVALLKEPSMQWIDSLGSIALITAVRMFQQWKAFDAIPAEGTITYKELSEKANVQLALLRRVAWVMVSQGLLKQEGDDRVSHTPRSLNYLEAEHGSDFHKTMYNQAFRAFGVLTEYFDKYGHKEPEDQNHIPVTFAYGTPELTFWGHLEQRPEQIEAFMRAIAPSIGRMPITGIYDFGWVVETAKDPSFDPERALFVDVGGGTGHCVVAIHKENPGIPLDRFVLQDQYPIIADLQKNVPEGLKGVRMSGLDFTKEEPHKNGLVYWLRRILHDYSDKLAVDILKRVVAAAADDSRILIAEDVASNPPHPMTAMMDLMILTCAGKERTMQDFEEVIAAAGLKVRSVSRSKETPMAVIECVKA